MASYEWIPINSSDDYERLKKSLDSAFCPEKIVPALREGISGAVKAILVEYGYLDKDYRSTYYNFYAKKGRRYDLECVRLHFFDATVSFDDTTLNLTCDDARMEDHYFGFMVLRPTLVATIGRTALSPEIRTDARGSVMASEHFVHLLGHTLKVFAFPSMDQHSDIAVCAHTACWSILRFYSERYPQHRELLVHDITMMAYQFDPGGLIPANGLDINEAERVFQAAGTFPLVVAKPRDPALVSGFFRQFLAYLESGFPLFVAMHSRRHAVAAIGHKWRDAVEPVSASEDHAWSQVESVVVIDDNVLPYCVVPCDAAAGGYSTGDFDHFIVPLPEKVFYPADAIERHSKTFAKLLANYVQMPGAGDLVRRYFITTISALRRYARDNQSQFGPELVGAIMQLQTSQFIWVVEYASSKQWADGVIAARAILDATASPHDPNPVWFAHGHGSAIFFDRMGGNGGGQVLKFGPTSGVTLGRMEQNLRTIVSV